MPENDQETQSIHPLPQHLAIIMDGNGRWASERGKPRHMGHRAGAQAAREVIETAGKLNIPVLSLFAFSSENWSRPDSEVSRLMDLFRRALKQALPKLHDNRVRVCFLGDRSRFPSDLRKQMLAAEERTAGNAGLRLNIAAGYGGRWDIVSAARAMAGRVAAGELALEEIDEDLFSACLSLGGVPAPDLFIRTGGEHRLSNFFLWDLAYTELYFTDCLWPDFGAIALKRALADFAERERRFGGVGGKGEDARA